MNDISKGGSTFSNHFGSKRTAFTVIELLVVIATIGVLAVMLLPALAGTQVQSKTAACTARFRQWAASANLYANDNRGWLPSFNPSGGGAFAWDVGPGMLNALYPYGMDVPVWFCPFRPEALDGANAWAQVNFGHPVQNVNELRLYWSWFFPNDCSLQGCCNYWVPRYNFPDPVPPTASLFPPDYSKMPFPPAFILVSKPTCLTYGWPRRLHDIAVPYVPFVSDAAGSGNGDGLVTPPAGIGTDPMKNLSPNTGHFQNGQFYPINLGFADGRVSSHKQSEMRAVFISGKYYWFY